MTPLPVVRATTRPEGVESALVDRIRRGESQAFEQLFHTYWPLLCDFAYGYLRSRDLVEEVVQDVFVRLWDQRGAWPVRGALRAYLFAATRYGALNVMRRVKVEERWAPELVREMATHEAAAGDGADVEAATAAAQLEAAVAQAVARQPERRREVLRLRWLSGLSYADIATTLGISVKTVENQLARGLRELRAELEAYRPK